jgi:dipeptidyl aminopeptidase/acylaminoacyl peptidase
MMETTSGPARVLATAACLAAGVVAGSAHADPVPLEDFFRHARVNEAVMSPSGRYIAATVTAGEKNRLALVIIDVQAPKTWRAIAALTNADVHSVRWIGNDRLTYFPTDDKEPGVHVALPVTRTIDREGKKDEIAAAPPWVVPYGGNGEVIYQKGNYDGHNELQSTSLYRTTVVPSSGPRLISAGAPNFARYWALDYKGEPRVAVSVRQRDYKLYAKVTPDAPWTLVQQYDLADGLADNIPIPLFVDAQNQAYVATRNGRDKKELYRFDLAKKFEDGKAIMSLDGYDFTGALRIGTESRVLGIDYVTDAGGTAWLVPEMKQLQAAVDNLLPGTINMLDCGACQNPEFVLVKSWSDHQPTVFRLYNAKNGDMIVLALARPWIKANEMAAREMMRFPARDGLSIPVHVTQPNGRIGPAPAVVMVHGGPNVRGGEWAWDAESQFLASRGYVVIEPEFRGSTGFGMKHYESGLKQWGTGMIDDIADATRWAIKQGYADPRRICIAGASYGGYATLVGLVRYPDLYRCGVAWAAVTDLDMLFTSNWSDLSDYTKEYRLPFTLGDPDTDKQLLQETSPINLTSKLTQPLLLAHGKLDYRVPIRHGAKFYDTLNATNKNVEWVIYPDEGHGWYLEADDFDFWGRAEKFLAKNLRDAK